MKILLLGSTGRTGVLVLKQALQRGMSVNTIARDRARLGPPHKSLTVFDGSVTDPSLLDRAMDGCEAVVSTLNVSRKSDWPWSGLRSPEDLISATMKSLISLAGERGVKRVITMSAWGVGNSRKEIPAWFSWLISHSNLRFPYDDHERQERLLANSDLDYTIVRAAGLTNSNRNKPLIVSLDNNPKPGLTVSRAAVAGFMLDALERGSYSRTILTLSW